MGHTHAYRNPLRQSTTARLLAFCLLTGSLAAQALPKVRVFATGGTISGYSANRDDQYRYRSGSIPPDKIIADLPEVGKIADLSYDEIAETGSGGINTKILLTLAKHINEWLAQPESTGAVVTHGTVTLEETAYFLNLVIHSDKPVVVVGAMRPFTSISRDGPLNFYNAVRIAADPEAKGMGVMTMLNEEIQASRDGTKGNTERVNTFISRDAGPIGYADEDRIVFYRKLLYRHTYKSEFNVDNLTDLPKVDIVYGYQEGDRGAIDGLIANGAKGIILDDSSTGNGPAMRDAVGKGVVFVQSDRKGSGRVLESGGGGGAGAGRVGRTPPAGAPGASPAAAPPTAAPGAGRPAGGPGGGFGGPRPITITADNLNAQKARILLRVALTETSDPRELQRIFLEY
jgi:L-asparaginase